MSLTPVGPPGRLVQNGSVFWLEEKTFVAEKYLGLFQTMSTASKWLPGRTLRDGDTTSRLLMVR
eukprot:6003170-Karenia_brevis.AAC.1